MVSFTAPGKVILFGEHAVVYGQPAIAVPVSDVRAKAVARPSIDGFKIIASDLGKVISVDLQGQATDALSVLTRELVRYLKTSLPSFEIELSSQIPPASGLGSGAAISSVYAQVFADVVGCVLDREVLNRMVYEAEKVHHGTPSGIDNTVIVYEQPVYFVRGKPIETLKTRIPFYLLIADTGLPALTKISVGEVRDIYDSDPVRWGKVFDAIGAVVNEAKRLVDSGAVDDLGPLMLENHMLLQELTVSSEKLDVLVQASMDSGALGAKLSGGGRGGNMIALVHLSDVERVKRSLLRYGAVRVLVTSVGS